MEDMEAKLAIFGQSLVGQSSHFFLTQIYIFIW